MSKPILPLPGSNANEQGAPSPWPGQATSPDDVPGMPSATRDPRTPGEMSNVAPEPYPGSGQVNEPWQPAAAPAPRRLRRE